MGTTPNFDRYAGYRVCGEYPGTPKISTDITITCGSNPIGRYVYAHVPGNSYLQMCEVQVFGKSKYTAGLSNGSVQTKCNSLTMLLRLFCLFCQFQYSVSSRDNCYRGHQPQTCLYSVVTKSHLSTFLLVQWSETSLTTRQYFHQSLWKFF